MLSYTTWLYTCCTLFGSNAYARYYSSGARPLVPNEAGGCVSVTIIILSFSGRPIGPGGEAMHLSV